MLIFVPVEQVKTRLSSFWAVSNKLFKKRRQHFEAAYPKNKPFATIVAKIVTSGHNLYGRMNIAAFADRGLAHLLTNKNGQPLYWIKLQTVDNQHSYDFANMRLGKINLVRKMIDKVQNSFGKNKYFNALERIICKLYMTPEHTGKINFVVKDAKPAFAFLEACKCVVSMDCAMTHNTNHGALVACPDDETKCLETHPSANAFVRVMYCDIPTDDAAKDDDQCLKGALARILHERE